MISILNSFWDVHEGHEILVFFMTAVAAGGIIWRVVRHTFKQMNATHIKVDAIEDLLNQIKEKGMTSGAEKSLRQLEKRIILTQAQVRLIMEIDNTGYVETNKAGGLIYCNSQFTNWTGLTAEEAKGYGWASAIHPEDRSRIINDWSASVKEERPIDLWYRYKRGSVEIPVHARSIVVRDDLNGEVLGFVALIVPT